MATARLINGELAPEESRFASDLRGRVFYVPTREAAENGGALPPGACALPRSPHMRPPLRRREPASFTAAAVALPARELAQATPPLALRLAFDRPRYSAVAPESPGRRALVVPGRIMLQWPTCPHFARTKAYVLFRSEVYSGIRKRPVGFIEPMLAEAPRGAPPGRTSSSSTVIASAGGPITG
jgi:hypothetical protein